MASSRCVRMKSLGNHPMKARRAMLVSAWTTSGFQGSWDGYPSAFIPECLQNIAKKKQKYDAGQIGQMFCFWAHTTLPLRRTKLLHQVTLKPTGQHKNCHEYVSIKKLVGGMHPSETWHLALVIKAKLCWIRASVAWFLGGEIKFTTAPLWPLRSPQLQSPLPHD
jgi:hypothetical protein